MAEEAKKYLFDILEASNQILAFTADATLETFKSSDLIQAAVERKFEIIGEALNKLKKKDFNLLEQIPEYKRIIGFRNIIAHGYEIIDPEITWAAVTDHLPNLKEAIKLLL